MKRLIFLLTGSLNYTFTKERNLRWGLITTSLGIVSFSIVPKGMKNITIYKNKPKFPHFTILLNPDDFYMELYTLENRNSSIYLCKEEVKKIYGKIPDEIYFTYR